MPITRYVCQFLPVETAEDICTANGILKYWNRPRSADGNFEVAGTTQTILYGAGSLYVDGPQPSWLSTDSLQSDSQDQRIDFLEISRSFIELTYVPWLLTFRQAFAIFLAARTVNTDAVASIQKAAFYHIDWGFRELTKCLVNFCTSLFWRSSAGHAMHFLILSRPPTARTHSWYTMKDTTIWQVSTRIISSAELAHD